MFIICLWSAWLESLDSTDLNDKISKPSSTSNASTNSKRNSFITMPALFSLELNTHPLMYLCLLVAEALHISLFDSQTCENTFRAARSMSGSFSSVVNFSVNEFLRRVEKLAVLQSTKCSSCLSTNNFLLPRHHKQSRLHLRRGPQEKLSSALTFKLLKCSLIVNSLA